MILNTNTYTRTHSNTWRISSAYEARAEIKFHPFFMIIIDVKSPRSDERWTNIRSQNGTDRDGDREIVTTVLLSFHYSVLCAMCVLFYSFRVQPIDCQFSNASIRAWNICLFLDFCVHSHSAAVSSSISLLTFDKISRNKIHRKRRKRAMLMAMLILYIFLRLLLLLHFCSFVLDCEFHFDIAPTAVRSLIFILKYRKSNEHSQTHTRRRK